MEEIRIGVRDFITFVMRSGDIDNTFLSRARALEGIHAHKKIQGEYGDAFQKEVSLSVSLTVEDVLFTVHGRVDGLRPGEVPLLDEIKSTKRGIRNITEDMNPLHWAQLMCYGYMYAFLNNREVLTLRLTYYSLKDEETKEFFKEVTFPELEKFFTEALKKYLDLGKILSAHRRKRDESLHGMKFPFPSFRPGQRECALGVYQALGEGKNLLLQAPTGIGKSMATIYPSLLRLGEGVVTKLFYFVGRSTQKQVALDALSLLRNRGMTCKVLELTGKEKICINEEVRCNPDDCPYAKGHFDRVNGAIKDLLENENFYRAEVLSKYARLHMVCPHELEMDLVIFCDVIIGDYNYFFDPKVRLSYFEESEGFGVLVDEAHGLIGRAREMYSGELTLEELQKVREVLRDEDTWAKKTTRNLEGLFDYRKSRGVHTEKKPPERLEGCLREFLLSLEEFLTSSRDQEGYEDVLEAYFNAGALLRLLGYYGKGFCTMYGRKIPFSMELICLDPSEVIDGASTGRGHIFFSATMMPQDFHGTMLSLHSPFYFFKVDSPFSKDHRRTFRVPVPLTYRHREKNRWTVAHFLKAFSKGRGNYLFFFPSYSYMEKIHQCFSEISREKTIVQGKNMSERERLEFLDSFKYTDSIRGFAVMGGAFSEGVDLPGGRLHGVAIVTIGLPQYNPLTEEMKKLFQERGLSGFDYTFLYPGMIKVAQSGGRLIRREEDRGVLLLLDSRFSDPKVENLLPDDWEPETVGSVLHLEEKMKKFWKEYDDEF